MGASSALTWRGWFKTNYPQATGHEIEQLMHACSPYFMYGVPLVEIKARVEWNKLHARELNAP